MRINGSGSGRRGERLEVARLIVISQSCHQPRPAHQRILLSEISAGSIAVRPARAVSRPLPHNEVMGGARA
jgi:hypothetical protein